MIDFSFDPLGKTIMTSLLGRYQALSASSPLASKLEILQAISRAQPGSIDDTQRTALVKALLSNVASRSGLENQEVLPALVAIKTLGRSPSGSSVIILPENLEILHGIAKASEYPESSKEALRAVANALLLNVTEPGAVTTWLSLGGGETCINILEREASPDYLFLASRTLFLTTMKESDFVRDAVESRQIVDTLCRRLRSLSDSLQSNQAFAKDALIDLLKTVFNFLLYYPRISLQENPGAEGTPVMGELFDERFVPLLSPLCRLYNTLPQTPSSPLSPPLTHVIHALINIPIQPHAQIWFAKLDNPHQSAPGVDPRSGVVELDTLARTYQLLDLSLAHYVPGDPDDVVVRELCKKEAINLDETLAPLVILLTRFVRGDEGARLRTKGWLLPLDLDRSQPLEKRADVLGRCLRLLGSIYFPRLKDTMGELFFAICASDARLMSNQIGYGNAAGFLMNHGVMGPPDDGADNVIDEAEEPNINPITGTTSLPTEPSLSDMTDEEKEREAEKLYVLFDRLEKLGMAVNPVRQAQQAGKLEDAS